MIPSKLSRAAAHRAATTTPSTACYACVSAHSLHQRRRSSSKASSSADRDNGKAATAATKATVTAADGADQTTAASEVPNTSRNNKGKPRREYRRVAAGQDAKKTSSPETSSDFTTLPSVPSVQNLSESDRSISNFFSLHRPISISHTFPPPSTPEAFGRIFSTQPAQDAWADGNSAEMRPEDVIYTLHSTIETIENHANESQDDAVRWEVIHESSSNPQAHHLDGQPRLKSLEELVAQFKPFRAPPPPQPFAEGESKSKSKDKKSLAGTSTSSPRTASKPRQKTFTTTITVTESTHANGHKTYSASSSPIVALPEAEPTPRASEKATLTRRERAQKLRQAGIPQALNSSIPVRKAPHGLRGERMRKMYLISVKRQRKLKMKKHKFKKLMKRTRNLRRRLDRT